MFGLSKMFNDTVVVLSELDRDGDMGKRSATDLAAATGIAEPTVARALKRLGAAGLVTSQRGAQSGDRIARPLSQTAIANAIAAMEGPIALAACVEGATGGYEADQSYSVRGRWDLMNAAIRRALSEITLADIQCPAWVPPPPRARRRLR